MEKTNGIHNYELGISNVFDASKKEEYLKFRADQWNVQSPSGKFTPELSTLPLTIENGSLPQISSLEDELRKDISLRKKCIQNNMDFYFPLHENETIKKDTLTLVNQKEEKYPPGTAILIRETNYAQYFAIAKDWKFDTKEQKLINDSVNKTTLRSAPLLITSDEKKSIQEITSILKSFSSFIPGPAKYGLQLFAFALGKASSNNGPSLEDINNMVRATIRKELVKDKLKSIHSKFSSVIEWVEDHYIPLKNKKRTRKSKLLNKLENDLQIEPFLKELKNLLQPGYRIPGFVLLLQGINMYLTIIQEKNSLGGVTRDIRDIAKDWTKDMLKVWGEVKDDRKSKLEVKKHSYSKIAADKSTVITHSYYVIHDQLTGNTIGDKNGPWKDDGKSSNAKEEAENRLISRKREVINELSAKLGDPDKTAENWKNIWIPQ